MIEPRQQLMETGTDDHGGIVESELMALSISPDEVLDFSVSTNPFGPPRSVLEAVASARFDRYPDRSAVRLREAIAEREGASADQVVVGNGAVQIIWTVAFSFLEPGRKALVVTPTFGEYEVASRLAGAAVLRFSRTTESGGFRLDVRRLEHTLSGVQPAVVWLCNPNNPTGEYLTPPEIQRLYRAATEPLFVVDEAYASFMPDFQPLHGLERLLRIRSLTKDFAVPGLRLGYAVGSRNVVQALRKMIPPWSVNAPAMEAGIAMLRDEEFLRDSIPRLLDESGRLREAIAQAGWEVLRSPVHYFLVRVGNATTFRRRMLVNRKIMVRDCTSFGLPDYIRISPRHPAENDLLISAMEEAHG